MNDRELETMRKSFNTVKDRSLKISSSYKISKLQERVSKIKKEAIENREELMEIAIRSFNRNGIDVFKAKDVIDAQNIIYDLVKDSNVVTKSKSNTLGEINIKSFLNEKNIDVVETDLGDRILQLKKEDNNPVHPTGPASHLDLQEISEIVSEAMDLNIDPSPREIMETVRDDVLNSIKDSDVGISGANSIASEEGSIVLVHNEGNISLVSLKKLHIIVAGIDKFVPSIEDAISVAKLQTAFATGNYVTSYINIISGPSKTADIEKKLLKNMYGAKKVVVILLDNGRSEAIDECMWCIGCGNCLVRCPVYNAVGNEFGFNNYLGGRGVAMSKFIKDDKTCFDSGLYMCTLCGLCTLNCPVSMPTNEILENIRSSVGFHPKAHVKISENLSKKNSPYE